MFGSYPHGRAIDITPAKGIFDWIKRNYPTAFDVKHFCDDGGYWEHWAFKSGSVQSYSEKCRKPAVYRYIHIGEGQEQWLDSYRCTEHKIEPREDLTIQILR